MLGFVVNNPVSRFVGNQFSRIGNWFEQENKNFETTENLRTSKHSRLTAARIVMKKMIAENNEYLSKENFESSKKILEDVTGLTNLTYDEHECDIIDGGLTLDLAGIKPKITIYKASALTKEEMLVLCPELKEIHIVPQKPLKKEEVKAEDKKQETADTKEEKSEVKEEAKTEEAVKPEESKTEEKPSEKEEVKKEDPAVEATKKEEKPVEEKKIDPTAPADLGLKTQEELTEEKKVVVEIKNATTTEKIEQAVCEGHEKGEVKIVSPSKKEEKPVDKKPEAEAKKVKKEEPKVEKQTKVEEKKFESTDPTVMVTFADRVKEGFSKFENEIFDKTIAKFSTGAKEGKLKFDIKITDVLVKKCDKENKIVTFVFVNDNKQYPLLETFYYTGNNKQSTTPFTDVNSFIKAHKERNEAAKKDEKLKPKCYNIKYSTIPGYVAPAK